MLKCKNCWCDAYSIQENDILKTIIYWCNSCWIKSVTQNIPYSPNIYPYN